MLELLAVLVLVNVTPLFPSLMHLYSALVGEAGAIIIPLIVAIRLLSSPS